MTSKALIPTGLAVLTLLALQAAPVVAASPTSSVAAIAFENADTNHDGVISAAEFHTAYPKLPAAAFKKAHHGKGAGLTKDEYAAFLKTLK